MFTCALSLLLLLAATGTHAAPGAHTSSGDATSAAPAPAPAPTPALSTEPAETGAGGAEALAAITAMLLQLKDTAAEMNLAETLRELEAAKVAAHAAVRARADDADGQRTERVLLLAEVLALEMANGTPVSDIIAQVLAFRASGGAPTASGLAALRDALAAAMAAHATTVAGSTNNGSDGSNNAAPSTMGANSSTTRVRGGGAPSRHRRGFDDGASWQQAGECIMAWTEDGISLGCSSSKGVSGASTLLLRPGTLYTLVAALAAAGSLAL